MNCFLCILLRSRTPQQGASRSLPCPRPRGSFTPPVSLAAPSRIRVHPYLDLSGGLLARVFPPSPKNIRCSCHSLLKLKPFHISIIYSLRPELCSPACAGFLPRLSSVFLSPVESVVPVCSSLFPCHTKALGLPPHPPPFHLWKPCACGNQSPRV
jgi:hypothetical protein